MAARGALARLVFDQDFSSFLEREKEAAVIEHAQPEETFLAVEILLEHIWLYTP